MELLLVRFYSYIKLSAVETDNHLFELLKNESLNWIQGEGEGEGCLWVSFCHCFSLYAVELSVYNCVSRDNSVTYRSETGDRWLAQSRVYQDVLM